MFGQCPLGELRRCGVTTGRSCNPAPAGINRPAQPIQAATWCQLLKALIAQCSGPPGTSGVPLNPAGDGSSPRVRGIGPITVVSIQGATGHPRYSGEPLLSSWPSFNAVHPRPGQGHDQAEQPALFPAPAPPHPAVRASVGPALGASAIPWARGLPEPLGSAAGS